MLLKVFDDYAKLDKVLAVFYEALRMFRSSIPFTLLCLFLKLGIRIQTSAWPVRAPRGVRRYSIENPQSIWSRRDNYRSYTQRHACQSDSSPSELTTSFINEN